MQSIKSHSVFSISYGKGKVNHIKPEKDSRRCHFFRLAGDLYL